MTKTLLPPAAPTTKAPLPTSQTSAKKITFGKIASATSTGHRVVIYGPGGIGKTTLATHAPGKVAFFDLDESLPRLQSQLTNVPEVIPCESWQSLRMALQSEGWDGIKTLVIDTGTRAEEMAVAHVLATVKRDNGTSAARIEDYGYGKGYQFVFDIFLPLLGDLDRHIRAGRNVVLIAHDCTTNVPNPAGEDWIRYEPRLQSPASGKGSIRLRVREWADHVLFLGYDIAVTEEGKGQGCGTRTLWPAELPHCMAKSRTTQSPIPVTGETDVWAEILK